MNSASDEIVCQKIKEAVEVVCWLGLGWPGGRRTGRRGPGPRPRSPQTRPRGTSRPRSTRSLMHAMAGPYPLRRWVNTFTITSSSTKRTPGLELESWPATGPIHFKSRAGGLLTASSACRFRAVKCFETQLRKSCGMLAYGCAVPRLGRSCICAALQSRSPACATGARRPRGAVVQLRFASPLPPFRFPVAGCLAFGTC